MLSFDLLPGAAWLILGYLLVSACVAAGLARWFRYLR